MTKLALTINGRGHGPMDVRDDLTMNDFLREFLGMTGTKFGCGAAQCLSCVVIVDLPDGTSHTNPQGNRTSKQGEQFGEIGFVPTRPFDFSAQ
jgi:aerobic-type carbon monoxide dehydrogenase small subunit (CoxS/CutS family)